jgi:hypothetical protein
VQSKESGKEIEGAGAETETPEWRPVNPPKNTHFMEASGNTPGWIGASESVPCNPG